MKLSEAIRLGSMMRPKQTFGMFVDIDNNSSYAIGAALEAIGMEANGTFAPTVSYEILFNHFTPDMGNIRSKCPIRNCPINFDKENIVQLIVHLNDDHRWSRERIADFVESLELAQIEIPIVDNRKYDVYSRR